MPSSTYRNPVPSLLCLVTGNVAFVAPIVSPIVVTFVAALVATFVAALVASIAAPRWSAKFENNVVKTILIPPNHHK